MGIGTGLRRWGKGVALVAVGVAGGGAAFAVASVPDSSNVIHACVKMVTINGVVQPDEAGPNLRIIDPSAGQLCAQDPAGGAFESALNWNQSGPTGPAGLNGATGPAGTPGSPGVTGAVGAPGSSPPATGTGSTGTGTSGPGTTVPGGSTLTIPGGAVITISGAPSATLQLPRLPGSASGHQETLTLDGTAIPIAGYALAATSPGSTASARGGGAGKASVHDLSITKTVDKSSPLLMQACATGKHFSSGIIVVRKAGKPYLTITMKQVLISSYQSGGTAGGKTPTEALSLNFTSVAFSYAK